MRTKIFSIITLFLVLFVFACISKKEIVKAFNKNGTVKVTVNTWEDDTMYLYKSGNNPFPMKTDSRWQLSFTKDTGKKIRCTAIKNFSSVIMLQKTFILNNSKWEKEKHELIYSKKFRWFYTLYTYKETFSNINPFDIPVADYLSTEELRLWMSRDDEFATGVKNKKSDSLNTAIDNKAEKWLKACYKKELVDNLTKAFEILKDPDLKPSLIQENIDTILSLCPGDYTTKRLIAAMAGYFRNENVHKLLDDKYSFINTTEKKYNAIADNFHEAAIFKIILPGNLVSNNAEKIKHDTLCWSVTAYKFFFNNYELKATSRIINHWTLWVTAILLVILIGIIYFKLKKDTTVHRNS